MVKILAGLKGSGKTKMLVDMVREALAAANGDVVVIEKDKELTYDIPYQARLIDAAEYNVGSYESFKGFLCGISAGNYDVTHVYIDNFLKLVNNKSMADLSKFVVWLDAFSAENKTEYVISVSADPADLPDTVKAYVK